MKWFDRWFIRQAKKAWENNYDDNPRLIQTARASGSASGRINQELDSRGAATIRIHAAHGGKVIEISHWDERKSEHERDLYIVRDDAELGPELTSIIMQHSLRY
jgi:hypothetical protein